jgi:hypothetical protein
LQPTGVSPGATKKDAPFLPQSARTCEPLPLEALAGPSGASAPPPDGPEGVPLELGETGALGEGEGSGVVLEGVLGAAGGVASGATEGVLGAAGDVISGLPRGALGVAGGVASGIAPDGGAIGGVLGGVTGEALGAVGVASIGCARLANTTPKVALLNINNAMKQLEIFTVHTSNFLTSFLRNRLR